MFLSQVIKKGLIPASVAAVAVAVETRQKSDIKIDSCRPSELPIYDPREEASQVKKINVEETPGVIESNIRTVRLTLTKYSDEISAYKRVGVERVEKSVEDVEWLIDYLQQEDNYLPKTGAVGIGALTGLIFGLRGGFFKKTLYTTIGALGMGAVCYPKEAAQYSEIAVVEAKKYLTIAYNFAYGVKKDDPPLELPSLPKFPTSVSEVWESVKSSAGSLISDKKESGESVIKEAKVATDKVQGK